uniref:Uncharacterized protein n=1 Tax=Rhizophora mucronata TaxID=61149 RepID=A0A2P2QQW6_RHIMU
MLITKKQQNSSLNKISIIMQKNQKSVPYYNKAFNSNQNYHKAAKRNMH